MSAHPHGQADIIKMKNMSTNLENHFVSASDSGVNDSLINESINFYELLPIIRRGDKDIVDARKLHKVLGSKSMFSHWIKDRIERCYLIENEDYVVVEYDYLGNLLNNRLEKNLNSDNQKVAKRDFGLTVSAAKEICMVENNSMGKVARMYFIECEKKMKRSIPKDFASALRAYADEVEMREKAEAEARRQKAIADTERMEKETALNAIEENQPKVDFANTFVSVKENEVLIREVAKRLEQNGFIIAEKSLRELLKEAGFFTKRSGSGLWELTAYAKKNGYGVYRHYYIDKYSGEQVFSNTVYMTGRGYKWLVSAINKHRSESLKFGKFVHDEYGLMFDIPQDV